MTRTIPLVVSMAVAVCPLTATAHDEVCDPKAFRQLVGQSVAGLEALDLPEIFRVIYPDSARDLAPEPARLNIEVDEGGTVTDVYCG